jgi:uncharacterized repeat protein (TIGR03803 family)
VQHDIFCELTVRSCQIKGAIYARASVFCKSILIAGAALALLATLDSPQAATFKVLYTFNAYTGDAGDPTAGLIIDSAGNLYGTTNGGGANYQGTVFKIAPDGTETLLHSFTGGSDGGNPFGGLQLDSKGNLWGTTQYGGAKDCGQYVTGCGVVFKLAPNGTEKVLHTFTGGSDGQFPQAGLTKKHIGATASGGANGFGTIFKIAANGTKTILYSFGNSPDGYNPEADVITDSAGNIYGTTASGGNTYGAVFKLASNGSETMRYSFTGGNDGAYPHNSSVVIDKAGNLYGTTVEGGTHNYCGVVFEVAPNGSETVLYSFDAYAGDGCNPWGGLIGNSRGTTFYGTTEYGGTSANCGGGCGTVFELKNGTESVLYSFTGGNDGCYPIGKLVKDGAGNLYGTTQSCGMYCSGGTVFEISP